MTQSDPTPGNGESTDNQQRYRPAPVMASIVVLLILIHALITLTDSEKAAWTSFALVPHLVFDGEPWRLVTSMALHAGWPHLFNNAFGFWIFGDRLHTERLLGSWQMLLIVLLSGIAGNLLSCFFLPDWSLSLGASGGTYGVLGAYFGAMVCLKKRMAAMEAAQDNRLTVAALSGELPPETAGVVLAKQNEKRESGNVPTDVKAGASKDIRTAVILLLVFIAMHYQEGHMNLWAHLGGLLSGVVMGWLVARQRFSEPA